MYIKLWSLSTNKGIHVNVYKDSIFNHFFNISTKSICIINGLKHSCTLKVKLLLNGSYKHGHAAYECCKLCVALIEV